MTYKVCQRILSIEIVTEWNVATATAADAEEGKDAPMEDEEKKDQLMGLVNRIIPCQMRIHAESEACDLLIEVERLDLLEKYVDKQAYNRVCL